MSEWNPRYLAYCRATGGLGPRDTWDRDGERYPGGKGAGFICWLQARLGEWRRETGFAGAMLNHHHDAFNAWLDARTPAPAPPRNAQLSFLGAA